MAVIRRRGDALLYDPHGPDRDCGDFETQAQGLFETTGGRIRIGIDWIEMEMGWLARRCRSVRQSG